MESVAVDIMDDVVESVEAEEAEEAEQGQTAEEAFGKVQLGNVLSLYDKRVLMTKLALRGMSYQAYYKAYSRGKFGKSAAMMLEELTCISALFWMEPGVYDTTGRPRIK